MARTRSGRDSLPESRLGLEGPPKSLEGSGGHSGGLVWLRGSGGVGGPPGEPEEVGRPSQRSVRGQESLLGGLEGVWRRFLWDGRNREGQEGSGDLSGEPGGIGRSGRGWEALPVGWEGLGGPVIGDGKCREAISVVWEWSGVPPEGPGRVGRPSWRAGKEWEVLLEGREGSGGHPGVTGGVGRHFQSARWGWEGWERSGGLPRGPEGLGGITERGKRSCEALEESREGLGGPSKEPGRVEREGRVWEALLEGWEWSEGLSGGSQGFGRDGRG